VKAVALASTTEFTVTVTEAEQTCDNTNRPFVHWSNHARC